MRKIALLVGLTASALSLTAADKNLYGVTVDTGVINYKSYNSKSAYADAKFYLWINRDETAFCNRNVSIANVVLSSKYKDFQFSNYFIRKKGRVEFGFGESMGYLVHDSITRAAYSINQRATTINKTQKAPFFSLAGYTAIGINSSLNLSLFAEYKIPLDRADLKDSYKGSAWLLYENGAYLKAEYNKFNFRGFKSEEDISLGIGYAYRF